MVRSEGTLTSGGGGGATKVWQCMRSVIARKKDGRSVQPDLSADDLNLFFVSVGTRIATEIRTQNTVTDLKLRLPHVSTCSFRPRVISLEELGYIVSHMRNSAAYGTDGVCVRVLKLDSRLSVVAFSTSTLASPEPISPVTGNIPSSNPSSSPEIPQTPLFSTYLTSSRHHEDCRASYPSAALSLSFP